MKIMDRFLLSVVPQSRIEEAVKRLYARGEISVVIEHRHVTERVICKACRGSGRGARDLVPADFKATGPNAETLMRQHLFYSQGICLACEGKGSFAP